MQFLDLTLQTLAENLACDEALLLEAEAGCRGELLRLWEWASFAVILGSGGRLAADVDNAACQRDRVPIMRRASGGGTVLLGPGCLCFSLVLDYGRSADLQGIRSSYQYVLSRVASALHCLLSDIQITGTSDLAAAGLKFSGNAQQRKRNHLLHHGTLLYGFDLSLVGNYLLMPSRQPEYRRQRDHDEFLRNLPIDGWGLRERLRRAWAADTMMTEWPSERVRQLVADKYERPEWISRR